MFLESSINTAGMREPMQLEVSALVGEHANIQTAELTAASLATQRFVSLELHTHGTMLHLFTDSAYVCDVLCGRIPKVTGATSVSTMTQLLSNVREIVVAGSHVVVHWVPSHCGIEGNERADALAKAGALEGGEDVIDAKALLPYGTVKSCIRQACLKQWQHFWDHGEDGRHLHQLKPEVRQTAQAWLGPRHLSSLRCRLRHGHCALNAHLFNIAVLPSPRCPLCHADSEDVPHYLLDCVHFADIRQLLLSELGPDHPELSLPMLLGTDSSLTANQVKAIVDVVNRFLRRSKRFDDDFAALHL